jgi:hypothetical protein
VPCFRTPSTGRSSPRPVIPRHAPPDCECESGSVSGWRLPFTLSAIRRGLILCPALSLGTASGLLRRPGGRRSFCFAIAPFRFWLPRCDLNHRLTGSGSIGWPQVGHKSFRSKLPECSIGRLEPSSGRKCRKWNHRLAVSAELIRRRIGCDFTERVSDARIPAKSGRSARRRLLAHVGCPPVFRRDAAWVAFWTCLNRDCGRNHYEPGLNHCSVKIR